MTVIKMTWRRSSLFDWMFQDIFSEFTEFDDVVNRMFDEVQKNPDQNGTYYYGLQVSVGPDGRPMMREFGNVRPTRQGQLQLGTREPLVDVSIDDKEKTLKIVSEMPGASKDSIKLNATEKHVTLGSNSDGKPYNAEIPLPADVDPNSADASYNNGILEVVFKLKRHDEPKSSNIKIK